MSSVTSEERDHQLSQRSSQGSIEGLSHALDQGIPNVKTPAEHQRVYINIAPAPKPLRPSSWIGRERASWTPRWSLYPPSRSMVQTGGSAHNLASLLAASDGALEVSGHSLWSEKHLQGFKCGLGATFGSEVLCESADNAEINDAHLFDDTDFAVESDHPSWNPVEAYSFCRDAGRHALPSTSMVAHSPSDTSTFAFSVRGLGPLVPDLGPSFVTSLPMRQYPPSTAQEMVMGDFAAAWSPQHLSQSALSCYPTSCRQATHPRSASDASLTRDEAIALGINILDPRYKAKPAKPQRKRLYKSSRKPVVHPRRRRYQDNEKRAQVFKRRSQICFGNCKIRKVEVNTQSCMLLIVDSADSPSQCTCPSFRFFSFPSSRSLDAVASTSSESDPSKSLMNTPVLDDQHLPSCVDRCSSCLCVFGIKT